MVPVTLRLRSQEAETMKATAAIIMAAFAIFNQSAHADGLPPRQATTAAITIVPDDGAADGVLNRQEGSRLRQHRSLHRLHPLARCRAAVRMAALLSARDGPPPTYWNGRNGQ